MNMQRSAGPAAVPGGGGGECVCVCAVSVPVCVYVCVYSAGRGAHAPCVAGLNVSQVFETGIWVFHVGSSAAYGSEEAALISPGSGGGGGEESGEGGSGGEAEPSGAGACRGAAAASDRHFAEHILFPDCFGGAGLSPPSFSSSSPPLHTHKSL